MNVYDFDHTLYKGDSTIAFWKYEMSKHPGLLRLLPHQCIYAIKYAFGKVSKEKFKEEFYVFFKEISNIEVEVKRFWDQNEDRFFDWYSKEHKVDDVVISASPEFIVKEGCRRIGISNVIASRVDSSSGKYIGKNCKGDEKVKRYKNIYGQQQIDKFYSDSRSDTPMAKMAKEAFLVREGKICPWIK